MTRWLYVSIVLTALASAGSVYVYYFQYDRLPAQVPIHWNIHGDVDGTMPKEKAGWVFLMMPATMAGMVLLTLVLPWLSPKQFEVDRFRNIFGYVMMLVVAAFAYIHLLIAWASSGRELPFDMGRAMIAGLFLMFALLGNVLGQVRRNFWMGVRVPWTLASEVVWNRTHRLAAWLFVATGTIGFVAVIAGAPLAVCFVSMITAVAVVPIGYSLVLYKRLEKQGKL